MASTMAAIEEIGVCLGEYRRMVGCDILGSKAFVQFTMIALLEAWSSALECKVAYLPPLVTSKSGGTVEDHIRMAKDAKEMFGQGASALRNRPAPCGRCSNNGTFGQGLGLVGGCLGHILRYFLWMNLTLCTCEIQRLHAFWDGEKANLSASPV